MAYEPVEAIEVRAWGKSVGALVLDPGTGFYAFEYTPAWHRSGIELAPLTMPLSSRVFVFPGLPAATYRRLPAMVADSLPDTFGNAIVDAALAREGVPRDAITPLDRLAYMGHRGVGALEFRPARGPAGRTPTSVHLGQLVDAARSLVRGEFAGDHETGAALANLIAVGTSAGGARAKAVIAWNPATGEMRSGHLDVPAGFEHWLLKLDGVGADLDLGTGSGYGRIEYAYHLMAREAGVTMSECRLLEEHGRAHFMTRRFDRTAGGKLHLQTLCALAELDFNQRGTHDYAQYLHAIDRLGLGADARAEGFRRMAFNLWAANCDDHTKNLSFLADIEGAWSLAPAYDLTHAHNPAPGKWTAQHQMSVNGRFAGVALADVEAVADRFGVPGWKGIVAAVRTATGRWAHHAEAAGLDERTTVQIAADMAALAPR
jgi:serine/threonine-protein kinase HipA